MSGQLAQLVEHSLDVRKVTGSNPVLPIFSYSFISVRKATCLRSTLAGNVYFTFQAGTLELSTANFRGDITSYENGKGLSDLLADIDPISLSELGDLSKISYPQNAIKYYRIALLLVDESNLDEFEIFDTKKIISKKLEEAESMLKSA